MKKEQTNSSSDMLASGILVTVRIHAALKHTDTESLAQAVCYVFIPPSPNPGSTRPKGREQSAPRVPAADCPCSQKAVRAMLHFLYQDSV